MLLNKINTISLYQISHEVLSCYELLGKHIKMKSKRVGKVISLTPSVMYTNSRLVVSKWSNQQEWNTTEKSCSSMLTLKSANSAYIQASSHYDCACTHWSISWDLLEISESSSGNRTHVYSLDLLPSPVGRPKLFQHKWQ